MLELGPENVIDYLRGTGRLAEHVQARAEALAWGVSNVVLRISPDAGDDLVIKQSREQLRTEAPWFSRLDRVWREAELMQVWADLLPPGVVPRVLFEDRNNYLFAMEAIEADHVVWKETLLQGTADPHIAGLLGHYLATIHRQTSFDEELRERYADREVFRQLRVDPFYQRIADVHPHIRPAVAAMIDEMDCTSVCLVHADFSPKNVLIRRGGLSLVDFETGHYGDPAFDLGFFLSHLLLKAVRHKNRCDDYLALAATFWNGYLDGGNADNRQTGPLSMPELQRRTIPHLASCMLARIDGKSPVDYLPEADTKDLVRSFCREVLLDPPSGFEKFCARLSAVLKQAAN